MTQPPLPPTHQAGADRRPSRARTAVAVVLGALAAALLSVASVLAVLGVVVADPERPGRLAVVLVEVPALRADLADGLAADIAEEARTAGPRAPAVDEEEVARRVDEVLASDDLREALLDLRVEDGEVDLAPIRDVAADAVAGSGDSPALDRAAASLRADDEALDGTDLGSALAAARAVGLVLALVALGAGAVVLGLAVLAAHRRLVTLGVVLGGSCALTLLLLHPVEAFVPDTGVRRHLADVCRSVGTLADPATSVVLGVGLVAAAAVVARALLRTPGG